MVDKAVVPGQAFAEPPHLVDPRGDIAIWYTEPPGLVLQLTKPTHGTRAHAEWLAGPSFAELGRRFPNHELIVLFDAHLATGRDPDFRPLMMNVAKALLGRAKRIVVVLPRTVPPALRSAMEVSVALLRLFGLPLEIAASLTYTLAQTGMKPLGR
jgi:hypothetical protein